MRAGMQHCNAHIYTVLFQNLYALDLILHAWSAKFFIVKHCTSRCLACYVMVSRLVRFSCGRMGRKFFSCRAMSSAKNFYLTLLP